MIRSKPLTPSDPTDIREWRARSQPLGRSKPPVRVVGFHVRIYNGEAESAPPPRKPIKPVSAKRARENRERAAMADRLWPDRREGTVMCTVPECGRLADDLNEILPRARLGSITDENNVHPCCRQHNEELTKDRHGATTWGFSGTRGTGRAGMMPRDQRPHSGCFPVHRRWHRCRGDRRHLSVAA